jgi:hypothetical protein
MTWLAQERLQCAGYGNRITGRDTRLSGSGLVRFALQHCITSLASSLVSQRMKSLWQHLVSNLNLRKKRKYISYYCFTVPTYAQFIHF